GVSERAAAGTGHHPRRIDVRGEESIEQRDALVDRERVRLAVGPENRQAAVLGDEPPAMRDETLGIRREIAVERGDHRREHAAYALLGHWFLLEIGAAAERTHWKSGGPE